MSGLLKLMVYVSVMVGLYREIKEELTLQNIFFLLWKIRDFSNSCRGGYKIIRSLVLENPYVIHYTHQDFRAT